jgi:2-oxoisovalerate dehydrogenase E2 component (dihydrolipoyl transacylase)
VYSLASALRHLAYLGRQVRSALWHSGTLTVSNVGPVGAEERAVPVLVWDVDRGDGKGERRLKLSGWALAGAELAAFIA